MYIRTYFDKIAHIKACEVKFWYQEELACGVTFSSRDQIDKLHLQ